MYKKPRFTECQFCGNKLTIIGGVCHFTCRDWLTGLGRVYPSCLRNPIIVSLRTRILEKCVEIAVMRSKGGRLIQDNAEGLS